MSAPDWDFWLNMPRLHLWQACALSVNIDPDYLERWANHPLGQPPDIQQFASTAFRDRQKERAYYKRVRLTIANCGDSQHFRHDPVFRNPSWKMIYLSDFLRWAANVMHWEDLPSELVAIAQAPKPSDAVPVPSPAAGWQANARLIGEMLLKKNDRHSVEQISDKVHAEMQRRHEAGEPGMTGRGGKVPSAGTIKRHALTGLKT